MAAGLAGCRQARGFAAVLQGCGRGGDAGQPDQPRHFWEGDEDDGRGALSLPPVQGKR